LSSSFFTEDAETIVIAWLAVVIVEGCMAVQERPPGLSYVRIPAPKTN
jgi:hypothetical protein